jgi:hypothetical protein
MPWRKKEDPDTDYGYHKMTYALLILGYLINHKKVYRLMHEGHLLKAWPDQDRGHIAFGDFFIRQLYINRIRTRTTPKRLHRAPLRWK